jgi:hypothetical protein
LLYSWFIPWWSVRIVEDDMDHVWLHPWGLEVTKEAALYIDLSAAEMPVWFTPAMWAYLGIVVAALLFSLWAKDKELKLWKVRSTLPSWTIGIVGFSYIVVAATAVTVLAIKAGAFGVPVIGTVITDYIDEIEGYVNLVTSLRFGYWLAYGAGALLILLALLRNKIIGKRDT